MTLSFTTRTATQLFGNQPQGQGNGTPAHAAFGAGGQ